MKEQFQNYFATVICSEKQLKDECINDVAIINTSVEVIKNYSDEYVQIVGSPHHYTKKQQLWDIPKHYLKVN